MSRAANACCPLLFALFSVPLCYPRPIYIHDENNLWENDVDCRGIAWLGNDRQCGDGIVRHDDGAGQCRGDSGIALPQSDDGGRTAVQHRARPAAGPRRFYLHGHRQRAVPLRQPRDHLLL